MLASRTVLARVAAAAPHVASQNARACSVVVGRGLPAESRDLKLPIIDMEHLKLADGPKHATFQRTSEVVAECLHKYGVLLVRDERVTKKDNDAFLDLLERYFEQPEAVKMKDVHPEVHYQVGATPSFVELPRDHQATLNKLKDNEAAWTPLRPGKDPKWRFFWRIGSRPISTEYSDLNSADVMPAAFPEWPLVMNTWGNKMLAACQGVSKFAAEGLGLPRNTFYDRMHNGPHLLAPTASDFNTHNKLGTVLAGFHYDLNFLTIHGQSRFPGLFVWLRDGTKVPVKVPDGCLLLQAGKQFEYATAGEIMCGFHEVVINQKTLDAIQRASAEGRSLWRISSTLFSHLASDGMLQPLGKFADRPEAKNYPPIKVGEQVRRELEAINLAS